MTSSRRLLLSCLVFVFGAGAGTANADVRDFNYTGAAQSWTVPKGVTSATFDLYGANGMSGVTPSEPSQGARYRSTSRVTPGETLMIYVGGAGYKGGFNGGGYGGPDGLGSGGGATDVRRGNAVTDRLLVAGGGGGTTGQSLNGRPRAPGGNAGSD